MKIILIILLFYLNLSFSQVNLDSINFKKNKEHIDLDKTSEENILYDSLLESLEKTILNCQVN